MRRTATRSAPSSSTFDNISEEDIIGVNIPTGTPLVYEFDDSFKPIRHYYLGDQEALKKKNGGSREPGQETGSNAANREKCEI